MSHNESKTLFILKKREHSTGSGLSSGLINSVKLIKEMLDDNDIESKIVEVIDNNYIDKEVNEYKPSVVIVEAIWVVPSKFTELQRLHPNVKWIVRIHSETPFIANEGNAISWINQYINLGISISVNSDRMLNDLTKYTDSTNNIDSNIILLPNYYKINNLETKESDTEKERGEYLNIGCFGAIRPLKNQLIQAIAAISYTKQYDRKLKFHINVSRLENDGSNNVLKNLRALFLDLDKNSYQLVEHGWYEHKDFLNVIKDMDLGLQVSLSETFNIVTADFVKQQIPVVVSNEINWIDNNFRTNPTSLNDIIDTIHKSLNDKKGCIRNIEKLQHYNDFSEKCWVNLLHPVKKNNKITHIFNKREIMGEIVLENGSHEILFELNFVDPNNKPKVSAQLDDTYPSTNFSSESDSFNVKLVDEGFILSANIFSNQRKINWIAKK